MKRITLVMAIIILFSATLGCGYKLMGRGGEFPDEITSLAIGPLDNRTKEANLSAIFISALRKEFIFRREVEIVNEHKAQAALQGTITSLTTSSLAYDEEARAKEYRVTITLNLLMIRRGNDEILWRGDNIEGQGEYLASTNVIVEEGRKDSAVRKIAADLAEEIYIKIKERF